MHKFYFNEYINPPLSISDFNNLMVITLKEFDHLQKKENLKIDPKIVLEKKAEYIVFGNYSLKDAILGLDKENKRKALPTFTKSPIADHYEYEDDYILESDHKFNNTSVINLAIVAINKGVLFTLPTHISLKKDELELKSDLSDRTLIVNNLYGELNNTNFIEQALVKLNEEKISIYDKLKAILVNSQASRYFEKKFFSATNEVQESIIGEFQKAKERDLPSPFCPGLNIIKDVSPNQNKKESKIYELKVSSPLELRLYFYFKGATVLLAGLFYKSESNEYNGSQNRDIKKMHTIIETMYKQI